MTKRHLSEQQIRRIQQNYKIDRQPIENQTGLLIAHHGSTVEIEDAQGRILRCALRQNREPLVVGDQVIYQQENNSMVVIGYTPRRSVLLKPSRQLKETLKPIAANLDVMVIVSASMPPFSEELLDQYLVAAELLNIQPCIVFNKTDLLTPEKQQEIVARLNIYRHLNYPVLMLSSQLGDNLDSLKKFLHDKTAIFVGPSGVGKSSLIQRFISKDNIKVGDVSITGHGCHTTTTARLYHLDSGGKVIDSPGVREFSLWNISEDELLRGFKEIFTYKGKCEFRNCRHEKESACALQIAVQEGKISEKRFHHFKKFWSTLNNHEKTF